MTDQLATQHRRALARLSSRPQRDLTRLVTRATTAVVARDVLMEAVPMLAVAYGDGAATLAVDYYDEARSVAGVGGRFRAEPAPLPGSARYEALVRWGVDPLFVPSPDVTLAVSKIAGGLQRIIANVDRDTIAASAVRDPQASGWQRVVAADSCKFCLMLADRGAVYTDTTVRFASHDNCNCSAAPAWEPGRTVSTVAYQASKRNSTQADRERVRDYLRTNY